MGYISTTYAMVVDAIKNKRRLRLSYNGGFRIVEPHAFGRGRKGHDLLRVYQVEGHSESGEPEGWKLMIASDDGDSEGLSHLTVLDETFQEPRPEYRRGDKAMVEIYAEL